MSDDSCFHNDARLIEVLVRSPLEGKISAKKHLGFAASLFSAPIEFAVEHFNSSRFIPYPFSFSNFLRTKDLKNEESWRAGSNFSEGYAEIP
jgi:hypothetical protein